MSLATLKHLSGLNIANNPLQSPPAHIVQQGTRVCVYSMLESSMQNLGRLLQYDNVYSWYYDPYVYVYWMTHMNIPVWSFHMYIMLPHTRMGYLYAIWVRCQLHAKCQYIV